MRFSDILVEFDNVQDSILDIISLMTGEDTHSLPLEAIQQELFSQGIEISDNSLFDVLTTLAIVDNIKDDIVYFNAHSNAHSVGNSTDAKEPDEDHVSKMAKKQIDKDLK